MKLFRKMLCMFLILALCCGMATVLARAQEREIPDKFFAGDLDAKTRVETNATYRGSGEEPEDGFYSLPTQVNPLYRDQYSSEDLPVPEKPADQGDYLPQATTFNTLEQAAAIIRRGMRNRVGTIDVSFSTTTSNYQRAAQEVMNEALSHTGNPQEGDYLAWQYGSWRADMQRSSANGQYRYTCTFYISYYTTAEQESQITGAVSQLISSQGLRYKSDYEKIYSVYDYICKNITYDYDNLQDDSYTLKHTAYAAIINKTAVCQGYALLFYRVMLELGIDCRIIAGDGGGPHGWNIVQLDGLYYNVDTTWDAGVDEYIWFLCSFWDFGGHERYMEYDTIAFHNDYPMAAESYAPGVPGTVDPYISAGYCGADITNALWWMGRDGTLLIVGEDNMYDYDNNRRPYYAYWEAEITRVVVEEGITNVGAYAFWCMDVLQEAILPSTVKNIKEHGFFRCENMETIVLPEGLESIGTYGFYMCKSLTNISLPETLREIGANCFEQCSVLARISLPANLEILGERAFYDCVSLETITIPAGLVQVGTNVFDRCTGLTTAVLEEGLEVVPQALFFNCTNLSSVVLPSTLKIIGSRAFEYCALTQVTLPDGLETIGYDAFRSCDLKEIQIPESVTSIGEDAFRGCINLRKANLPKNLTSIESGIFASCPLESIEIPAGITTIGESAFSSAEITSLVIPEGVTRIEKRAFSGCDRLTDLTLPDSLEFFSGFSYCDNLTSIVIPEGVTEIGQAACQGNILTSITIPDSVTKIGSYAFQDCENLEKLELPQGLTEIPDYMAGGCGKLTELTIPASVTRIDREAFLGCTGLTSVTFSEGLKTVDSSAFAYCISLTEIILPSSVTLVGDGAFMGCSSLRRATISGYVAWDAFADCANLAEVELLNTVNCLSDRAFRGCSSLTSITIPASVTEIRDNCFDGCSSLTQIVFDGDLPDIHSTSFSGVTATAFYPLGNPTYTDSSRQNFGGNLTWGGYTPACVHCYESVVTEPTCTEQGYTTLTCSLCGHWYYTDITSALGHSMGSTVVVIEATCQNQGLNRQDCTRCDHYETTVIMSVSCRYTSEVTEPTCTEQGYITYTCIFCGESHVNDYTEPLSHDYVDGICSRCGEAEEGEEPSHIPGDITGDGEVNNKDLTRLFRYLSGFQVEVNEAALDVTGDGAVNNKDLTRLFRYLSGFEVEIF